MKDTYYFQHDYNSSNDPKISALIGDFGPAGYGIWWQIVELLHQEEDHELDQKQYIYKAIAKQIGADAKQVEDLVNACINDYELLKAEDGKFYSYRVKRNIEKRQEISYKRSKAGKKGAIAKQVLSKSQASDEQNQAKERKGKEIKGKEKKDRESDQFETDKITSNLRYFADHHPDADLLRKQFGIKKDTLKQQVEDMIDYYLGRDKPIPSGKPFNAIRQWLNNSKAMGKLKQDILLDTGNSDQIKALQQ